MAGFHVELADWMSMERKAIEIEGEGPAGGTAAQARGRRWEFNSDHHHRVTHIRAHAGEAAFGQRLAATGFILAL